MKVYCRNEKRVELKQKYINVEIQWWTVTK